MKKRKLLLIAIVVLMSFSLLVSCGSEKKDSVGTLVIASKSNTPNLVKGWLMVELFKANGFEVKNELELGGTNIVRSALENDQIDLYMEYTGTGWTILMKEEERLTDPEILYQKVSEWDAENGIIWYDPAPENDCYTTIMRRDFAEQAGIETMTDLANAINSGMPSPVGNKWSYATGPEYAARADGLLGIQEYYGFEFEEVVTTNPGIYYTACRDGEVTAALGSQVDARIAAYDLINLIDDKEYNIAYNPCIIVRKEIAEKYPQIGELAAQLAPLITNEASTELNRLVDIEGIDPQTVARNFLIEHGLIAES